MAHFAKIENGLVTQVIVVGNEYENMYSEWRKEFGENWVQTSYNNRIRKQYAGIGYSYDLVADVFITPQPYKSWSLNENFDWQAPTPRPEGINWVWDEENLIWQQLEN
jgi:hypothetical protein